jgi:riboflavin kinase/FMN adenylyltransferase
MAEILRGAEGARERRGPCAVTVGAFDGVHLGHQEILQTTIAMARDRGIRSCAVTFDPHPAEYAGIEDFRYLMDLDERVYRLAASGVDLVRVLPFDDDLAATPPPDYVRDILVGDLGAKAVVVGATHRFGRGGRGDTALLDQMSATLGFTVRLVPATTLDGDVVSSSRIRGAVAEGRMKLARRMLGRPFGLNGSVVPGYQRGAKLGFPTANLSPPPRRVLPALGIYAGTVEIEGQVHPTGVHVGPVPTFGCDHLTIEAHILDFRGDLLGRELRIDFLRRLRDVVPFDNQDELVLQIERDLLLTRQVVDEYLGKSKAQGEGA